jgi:hypothetical protein
VFYKDALTGYLLILSDLLIAQLFPFRLFVRGTGALCANICFVCPVTLFFGQAWLLVAQQVNTLRPSSGAISTRSRNTRNHIDDFSSITVGNQLTFEGVLLLFA